MTMNVLSAAAALTDDQLLARLGVLAGRERDAIVDLVAHLAELDGRPSAFAARGCGTLFGYCTQVLRLSEDAACSRIEVARACRRFPMILDLLASGAMSLSTVRMVSRLLTSENHESVLARASGLTRRQVEALVAELAPQPDVASSIRKLPAPKQSAMDLAQTAIDLAQAAAPVADGPATPPPLPPAARPVVRASAPKRYRVQFTIGEATHGRLRRLQDLLRREIPSGDPAVIFGRAIALLLDQVERKKLGAPAKPTTANGPSRLRIIRPGTDRSRATPLEGWQRTPMRPSRYVPRSVRRAVYERDQGRCTFVSDDGRRCTERAFIDFHHGEAHAKGGLPTIPNMTLHCRRHNQLERDRVFGPRRPTRDS